ncbi:MAG: cysteine hydrolase [Chloroflexi bacterium]|nr:cysteine hydrolase [Chloroflexota bacterium]
MSEGLKIDPKSTALVVIDMQNGYCHDGGGLRLAGLDNRPQIAIVPRVKSLVRLCRKAQIPIVWVLQEHYPDDATRKQHIIPSHMDKSGACVAQRNTWDAEPVQELKAEMRPEDHYVKKHRMSAFYNTTLEVLLRMLGRRLLIISGVSTNVCVESTIRDAYFRDFDQILVSDCTASLHEEQYRATLKNTEIYFGTVMTLQELSETLGAALE